MAKNTPGVVTIPKGCISYQKLVDTARLLCSEDDDGINNPEYHRALCELVGDALGTTQEGYLEVAAMLGVSPKVWKT